MFFFASFYYFLQFLRGPGPLNILLTGLATGLALLSKFTADLIPPIFILALLIFFAAGEHRKRALPWRRYAAGLATALIIALLALNAGYGFRDTLTPLSAWTWKSGLFNSLSGSLPGKIPLPLPHLYVDAIDEQTFNRNIFIYYLNGQLSPEGWASYYWIALALKTPIPLLLGTAAGLFGALRRGAAFESRLLWIVPAVFMLIFTFFVRIDMGFRYLLPMFPFLILIAAAAVANMYAKGRAAAMIAVALCVWYAASIVPAFGNGLAYFNEFAGGPGGGHRYLLESNIDWGQNLGRLKKYVDENNARPLLVYNYGLVPASAYGIRDAGWVPCEPARAVVAISVNYLEGIDPFQHRDKECFHWLARRKPVAILGHGLYVYDTRGDGTISSK